MELSGKIFPRSAYNHIPFIISKLLQCGTEELNTLDRTNIWDLYILLCVVNSALDFKQNLNAQYLFDEILCVQFYGMSSFQTALIYVTHKFIPVS